MRCIGFFLFIYWDRPPPHTCCLARRCLCSHSLFSDLRNCTVHITLTMDGLRGELEGTLARTSQKKQVTLNRHTRFLKEQEKIRRYGFASRPASTGQVADVAAADHFYREVRAEFSDKYTRMARSMSIDTHGVSEIRAANAELNALRREMSRWADRIVALGGERPERDSGESVVYYGVARDLPEALEGSQSTGPSSQKRERDDLSPQHVDSAHPIGGEGLSRAPLFDGRLAGSVCLFANTCDERRLRKGESAVCAAASSTFAPQRTSVSGYTLSFSAEDVPSAMAVWGDVLARKKAALRARLAKQKELSTR